MADLKLREAESGEDYLSEGALREGIELLFYAYRYFTSDPDAILARYGFGRAHHRVLHFVGGNPGITVADLLVILRITKQSLSRVLSALVRDGYIVQKPGPNDRRQRRLHLTDKGVALEAELSRVQQARVAKALREAGPDAVRAYRKVLAGLIDDAERDAILRSIHRTPADIVPASKTPGRR
jgi:DNA-binding MarR family transcriptional regulator